MLADILSNMTIDPDRVVETDNGPRLTRAILESAVLGCIDEIERLIDKQEAKNA